MKLVDVSRRNELLELVFCQTAIICISIEQYLYVKLCPNRVVK